MADGFGAYTDHFGIASADLIVVGSSEVPDPMSRATADDENGDHAAATWYGNTGSALKTVSTTYRLKSGTLNLNTLQVGELEAGTIADNVGVTTSNSDWPEIVLSGKTGCETVVAPTGKANTWTLPDITITGAKRAQLLGFTIGEGCALTGSGLTATIDLAQLDDGEGEPAAHGVSGAVATQTAELVRVTAAPSWTKHLLFTETQAPGEDQPQAGYHTASAAAEIILDRDSAA